MAKLQLIVILAGALLVGAFAGASEPVLVHERQAVRLFSPATRDLADQLLESMLAGGHAEDSIAALQAQLTDIADPVLLDAALYETIRRLRTRPPGSVPAELLDWLAARPAAAERRHDESPNHSVALFDVARAARGLGNQWAFQAARTATLEATSGQRAQLAAIAAGPDSPEARGILSALSELPRDELEHWVRLADNDPVLARSSARSLARSLAWPLVHLALGEAEAVAAWIREAPPPDASRVLLHELDRIDPGALEQVLGTALEHSDPAIRALALARMATFADREPVLRAAFDRALDRLAEDPALAAAVDLQRNRTRTEPIGDPASARQDVVLHHWTESPGTLGLGYPVPEPIDTPLPFDGFRSHEGLVARLDDLAGHSPVVHASVAGQSRLGRDILAFRLGTGFPSTPEGLQRPAVMYAGTVHPREWQSPEVVTGLVEFMAEHHADGHWVQYIAEHVNIVTVPVLNVDGFLMTQRYPNANWIGADPRHPDFWPRDGRMRRKNHRDADEDLFTVADHLRGVDINRNNPPFWGNVPETGNPDDLVYRGPAIQSEPETGALLAAAELAPADRIRFYADMHSFARVFFSVMTGNPRRNQVQNRLLSMITWHHQALPDGRHYANQPGNINAGIGTTSEYFGHFLQVPSMTWEIEPGSQGGVEYGGFGSNGHDGFILPESEISRVRRNLAESMAAAAYHMAGPPHILRAELFDVATGSLAWSAAWDRPQDGQRTLVQRALRHLEPGHEYLLRLAFSKPMRWRDDSGAVIPFPGQPAVWQSVNLGLDADGESLEVEWTSPAWASAPGAGAASIEHYRDDSLSVGLLIHDTPENQARLAASDFAARLSVDVRDLTGQQLDANPATVVDWVDGAWSGYESHVSSDTDIGGTDRSLVLPVRPDAQPPLFLTEAGHSAHWFDPGRSGEGWSLEILDNDRALGYWFTYDEDGGQRWLFGVGQVEANRIHFPELLVTSGGRFGPDFDPEQVDKTPAGSATMTFSGCDQGWFEFTAFGQRLDIDFRRLTRTMAVDCNPPPDAAHTAAATQSGSWFDPAHDGEGFTVQWMTTGQALVTWFSYDPDGNQYWMQGVGEPDGSSIHFPDLLATRGGRFGAAFDPEDVVRFHWGELSLTLGCEHGSAEYVSALPEFGSGSFELIRLTFLNELDCR